MSAVDSAAVTLEQHRDRFYGKYRGLVSSNGDPLGLGRIQAQVPELLGTVTTGWAAPAAPYAGSGFGFFAIPPAGSGVWIEFEAGDPSRPIWSGTWWGTGDVPQDQQGSPAQTTTKILRSEMGLIVALDDSAQTITLSDSAGANILQIKVTEGAIEMKSTVQVTLEAPLINHGESAQHPAVFGDSLLTYLSQLVTTFNAHVHPGELALGVFPVTPAPPVAPQMPPTPELLSVKNMVG